MRFIELELESTRTLDDLTPPLHDVQALSMPDEEHVIVCDRPASVPRLSCFAPRRARELRLDAPGFLPRLLVDSGERSVLAIGGGENSGVLFAPDGSVVRRYNLGEGIMDAAFDPAGNIVVLRGHAPLLDRYDPEGRLEEDDAQVARIHELTSQTEGSMLVIQHDGALWLNLAEKFDGEGELLDAINPAEVFGEGRVAADLLAWDGVLVLGEDGRLWALTKTGRRLVRLPEADIKAALGRGLSAGRDLFVTREERLWLLATGERRLLAFRILSE